ncbi:M1 family metallopeptidase [Luteipulveratus sp. YIM 133132]|uniref:M1 family metallopeptidase n=1 Tax=Luteipulveratus flavus TaxID=3031728 RepID=UPI0023AEDA9E|nr:M1 family metallopeptidase [Luteipulveratus sp. YIM 133132]MDE9365121.1 M1 family metallopeptidase [Luteipulveratus sp. YIM 133132]
MPARTSRLLRLTVASAVALGVGTSTALAAPADVGAPGIGDPYYKNYGNGGYDVGHYGINVAYDPSSDLLTGTTTITATATQDLRRFNLDFVLKASAVTVNGAPARFSASSHELTVTPATPVTSGGAMTIVVTYAGVPSKVSDNGIRPWVKTADGAVAVGEPEIAAWWYPSNDHPRDKATFDVRATVPKGVEALSNGLVKRITYGKTTDTWVWRSAKPQATYLTFLAVGQFDVTQGTSASGLPWINAVASNGGQEGTYAKADLARTPEVIDWHTRAWGKYPFEATGGVAPAADFGFALENQTRPVYTRGFWRNGPNIYVVVHEQGHQWYGDGVSVHNWKDIWLNEGFATFTTWYWSETHGEGTGQQILQEVYGIPATDAFWSTVIGDPGAGNEFDGAVYDRGAATLQALRNRIGDPAFFQVMRTWAAKHRYGNAQIADFIALAERVSGQDLGRFFHHWLYTGTKPAATAENGLDGVSPTAARVAAPKSLDKIRAVQQVELSARH